MDGSNLTHGPHAMSVPFDNSTNGFVSETTQEAIEEAKAASISYYYYSEEEEEEYNTAPFYISRVQVHPTSIPAGTYRVSWSFESKSDVGANTTLLRCRFGTTNIMEMETIEDQETYYDLAGFKHLTLDAGTYAFYLQYKRTGSGAAYIRRARLEFWRIS